MAETYIVTLYYNTGFNQGNVPGDVGVLTSATQRTFDSVFLFQNRYRASIKIKAEVSDVQEADYCRLGTTVEVTSKPTYYVITGYEMLSSHTARLDLLLDPLLTSGGLTNLSVIGGWVERAHVGKSGDTLFSNIISEPWQPSSRLVIRNRKLIHDDIPEASLHLVGTTTDLSSTEWYAKTVISTAESAEQLGGSVTFPALPSLSVGGTIVQFQGNDYQLPGIRLFNLDDQDIRDAVSILRSIGVESAITTMYTIPATDVTTSTMTVGENQLPGYQRIIGKTTTYSSGFNYLYGTVKNNKAVCLYNTYTVLSTSSANKAEFDAHELYSGGSSPDFKVSVDPAPNGTCYCQPTYFEGASTQYLEHSVAGMQWLNAGFVYEGSSGSAITIANAGRQNSIANLQTNFANTMLDRQALSLYEENVADRFDALLNTIPLIGGGSISDWSLLGPAAGYARANQAYERNLQNLDLQRQFNNTSLQAQMGDRMFTAAREALVAAPEIAFPVNVNASCYFGNSFMIYQTTLSDNDLKRFDDFLTQYGYSMDKKLEMSDLNNRTYFNYIKTSGAQLKSSYAGQKVLDDLATMFNNGVRIWHVLPTNTAYNDNPAKEGT